MKRIILCLIIMCMTNYVQAQDVLSKRVAEIEDKLALKELVDRFSILADQKKGIEQMYLFTEDATVETYANGKLAASMKGNKQIGETFNAFLNSQQTVYHINGQQVVTIEGDTATGISYCLTVLFSEQDGKTTKRSIGVIYHDEFVKQNGTWLIAKRISDFTWQD